MLDSLKQTGKNIGRELTKWRVQQYRSIFSLFALVMSVAPIALSACGGGGSPALPPISPPSQPQLSAVVVSPNSPLIHLGTLQQFAATGNYSDGTSQDVTALASWSTSNSAIAAVSNDQANKGIASSVAVGKVTITASLNGIDGAAELTVDPAALVSIVVLPAPDMLPPATGQIAIAAELQFVAAGLYTDNTVQDITASATWNSSSTAVAVVSNTQAKKGIATGISEGAVTLDATLGSIKGTASLTVLPVKTLDFAIPNTKAIGPSALGIDGNGNALAVWNYQFTGGTFGTQPELYTASYTPGGGWSPKTLIDFGTISDFPATPVLAMNTSGVALLAWMGHNGVYASKYTPGSGWQQAKVIASGSTVFLTFANSLQIVIDGSGNGLLVWANDNGNKLFSSQYLQNTDTWSTPLELQGVDRGMANSALSLSMNASGTAVLLWENWGSVWTLNASLFLPGTGLGAGWQIPQPLYQSQSWQTPTAAINDAGEITTVWVDYVTDFPNTSLYAKQFIPNQGWQAQQAIALSDINRPADPVVAMNDSGNAIVVWRNRYDKAVRGSRYIGSSGWQASETLWPTGIGDPTVLRPHIANDGRILAAWVLEDSTAPFKVGLRRYVPGSGWEAAQGLPYIKHKGDFSEAKIAFNPSGTGVTLWRESYDIYDGQFFKAFSDFYVNTQIAY